MSNMIVLAWAQIEKKVPVKEIYDKCEGRKKEKKCPKLDLKNIYKEKVWGIQHADIAEDE